ncbi:MAG: hypothetical protein WD185_06495, partial [Sneathiella sp.]
MSISPAARNVSPTRQPGVRRVSIFGSTGSIGVNTLDLIAAAPEKFSVEVLSANENVTLLAAQARQFGARRAVIANETRYAELKSLLA